MSRPRSGRAFAYWKLVKFQSKSSGRPRRATRRLIAIRTMTRMTSRLLHQGSLTRALQGRVTSWRGWAAQGRVAVVQGWAAGSGAGQAVANDTRLGGGRRCRQVVAQGRLPPVFDGCDLVAYWNPSGPDPSTSSLAKQVLSWTSPGRFP
jgi:hypothetical protein